jgi:hypothetical protein
MRRMLGIRSEGGATRMERDGESTEEEELD